MFEELYQQKTGNMWGNMKTFVKYPNKFYPLEIDYGQVREPEFNTINYSSMHILMMRCTAYY